MNTDLCPDTGEARKRILAGTTEKVDWLLTMKDKKEARMTY